MEKAGRRLERITRAAWADRERRITHLDIAELLEAPEWKARWGKQPRRVALAALREVRRMDVPGVIIAHLHGMPCRLEARR